MSTDGTSTETGSVGQPRLLNNRYELGEVIGHGGMAEVHEGRDQRLGRRVAIKLLRSDLARDPAFHARFQREAQSSAALNHPNIVAVYDTGETDVHGVAAPYIVMEYVDGTTLRDMLKSGHRFLPERALEIASGVLAALDYSHRHGTIHRDIKPGNVMLTRTGQVKVVDFGIARAVADSAATMTQTSAVLGTAQYLSPEQARGEVVDARSDLYSTGCLLYELFTGRPPFMGDSPVSVAYQHVRENPVPPSQINPDVTPAADSVVLRALAKSPDARYQTAADMRADVDRAAAGTPVLAVPLQPVEPSDSTQVIPAIPPANAAVAPPPRDRSRTTWFVLLALAVIGALALALFLGRSLFSSQQQIRVPDVAGQTKTQATQELTSRGLAVGSTTSETSDQPADTVLRTSPPANQLVAKNTVVDLVLSAGPEKVAVPTLVGLSQSQAVQAINQAGLVLGALNTQDSDKPVGTVISVNPPEGTAVDKGSSVDLTISSGKVAVPNVVGQTEAAARAAIVNAGFDPVVLTQESPTDTAGTVIAQSPTAGTLLQQGRTVTITVATAPSPSPSPSTTSSPTTAPSTSPSPTP